jgi:hypothetical protein
MNNPNLIHPTPVLIVAAKEMEQQRLKEYKALQHLPTDDPTRLKAMLDHCEAALIYIRLQTGRSIDPCRTILEQS